MSILGEKTLIGLLPDLPSLEFLAREGVVLEAIPTESLRPVYSWAMDYYTSSGKAPSVEVLKERWGALLADNELDIDEEPQESIEWAKDDLTSSFVRSRAGAFSRRLATDITAAAPEDRVAVLSSFAAELSALALDLQPRYSVVDMRESADRILTNYEVAKDNQGQIIGLGLGLPQIDEHTGGIHPGEMAVVAAPAKMGKAATLDTPVLTPTGWVRMGDIRAGDEVVGSNGRATRVRQVHPQGIKPIYRVTVDDGTSTLCADEHLWSVQSPDQRHGSGRYTTLNTRDLKIRVDAGRLTYLPLLTAVEHPEVDLPLHPYLVGALLGDGGYTGSAVTFTKADLESHSLVERYLPAGASMGLYPGRGITSGIRGIRDRVAQAGLGRAKHVDKAIPSNYLITSIDQRRNLLAGLLDTDGYRERSRSGGGNTGYSTSSPTLAADVQQLVLSLGGSATIRSRESWFTVDVRRKEGQRSYRLSIRLPESFGCPFLLPNKVAEWNETQASIRPSRRPARKIVSVEYEKDAEAQCITVSAQDNLYVTENYIVTHNSFLVDHSTLKHWEAGGCPGLYTLENSIEMTEMRLACLATHVSISELQSGTLSDDDYEQLRQWVNDVLRVAPNPLRIFNPDTVNRNPHAVVQSARASGCDSIILDQLTFMETSRTGRRDQGRAYELKDILHDLKGLVSIGRDPIPVLMAHQIKREGIKAAEKTGRLQMTDMADSSEVERAVDFAFGLYASEDDRAVNRMQFQGLAARRVPLQTFDLLWNIEIGLIQCSGVSAAEMATV